MNIKKLKLQGRHWALLMATSLLMTIGLSGCKNGLPPLDTAVAVGSTVDIQFNGGRRLSISGRTMGQVGSNADALAVLPGVSILAVVNGISYSVTSSAEGGFAVRDVPMRPATDTTSTTDNLATVVIYIEKSGWVYDGDAVTLGNQNWISVKIDSHLVDSSGNYHVDLGPLKLTQSALKVTSSLVKSSSVLSDRWISSAQNVGGAGSEDEVYMRDVDSSITLTFNMPVDTSYNQNFVELFDPTGVAHSYSGTWDSTGLVYTIVPFGLTASNDDNARWQLRIARPVRAFETVYATRKELDQVTFLFQVLSKSRNTLLLAQAPVLAPELDGTGYTEYKFDAGTIYKTGYRSGVNTDDVVTSGSNICIVWNQSQAANGYRIYSRSPYKNYGAWADVTSTWLPIFYLGDGRAYACNSALYSSLANAATLSGGDKIQLIVTPRDKDGNEGAISSVATSTVAPLTISDNWSPSIDSGSWSKAYKQDERDEYFNSSPTGRLGMTFSEVMDPWHGVVGSISNLSGLMSSVTGTLFKLTTTTHADVKINYTMKTLDTTLASSAKKGDTYLKLSSVDGLKQGYVLKIYESTLNNMENVTITAINSLENGITVSALTNSYPSGAIVRLTQGESGHSLFVTNTSGDSYSNQYTLSVTDGSKFLPGQSVNVYNITDEEDGPTVLGTYTISSATVGQLTFTAKLGRLIPSGSSVADSSVSISEPQPRAQSVFAPAQLEWSGATVSTSLAINNFATSPDAQLPQILVNSISGLSINDVVVVDLSSVTASLTSKAVAGNTTLSIGTHSFLVGDKVRVSPVNVSSKLSASSLAAATSLSLVNAVTVLSGESVVVTDPAVETRLSFASSKTSSTISVDDVSGIVQGQTIIIDSGVETKETKTVSSISGNTITLNSALANDHGEKGRVTRAQLQETKGASSDVTTSSTLNIAALTNAYSTNAYISVTRNSADYPVTAINSTQITISSIAAGFYYPPETQVSLLSYPETRRITAIDGNILTLSANLSYSHRLGAAVKKDYQYTMLISTPATTMASWVVGDTVVCDSLASVVTGAHKDRFYGTLIAMDSGQGLANVSSPTRTGLITTTNLSCVEMGDAIKVEGAQDSNGQAIRNSLNNTQSVTTDWGNKINLSSGTAK